jgi:predicted ATPase/DNA-binding winged helix-turn-helix (wHTH) protein
MSGQGRPPVYQLEDCEIDLGRRELRRHAAPVPIGGRAFEILETLIESAGDLVRKDDLRSRVWRGAIVEDSTLQVHISAVRKALGQYRGLLKTESGRGYRLLGNWAVRRDDASQDSSDFDRWTVAPRQLQTSLPARASELIGRNSALEQLRDILSAYRMVTLTGPGGIGKTALAIELARKIVAEFDGGGWFVELTPLTDPTLVPSAVASVLGLKLGGDVISDETVARAVGGQNILLVLDNCEHIIDAAASFTESFVRLCPRATILATSREVLRIDGEHVYRIPPLDVPAAQVNEPSQILSHSAVELFVARTKSLGSEFLSHDGNPTTIAAICRHLDGMPLAIEFAAARAAMLGVQDVATGLRDRFALLTVGRRTALRRHQTLRATLDWSYELLPETEQQLLRRLAVFPTGFTVDAVVAVTKDLTLGTSSVMEGIASLVSKSLVTLDNSENLSRWRLLETIRAYAFEKLVEAGDANMAARQHAMYFRDLSALSVSGFGSRLPDAELSRRVREIDNVRAALDWSFSSFGDIAIGVDLAAAYAPVWLHLSLIVECRERCERALLSLEPDQSAFARQRMWLQIALGNALFVSLGSPEQTEAVLTRALEFADTSGDLEAQAQALAALSTAYVYHRDYSRAQTTLKRLREVAYEIGDPALAAVADRRLGTRLLTSGRLREARQCLESVLQSPAPPEDHRLEFWNYLDARAMARALLARGLCLQGFAEMAHNEAKASLEELQFRDHPLSLCRVLNFGMCRVATMTGDYEAADHAIARSIEVATRLNAPFWQTVGRFLEGKLLVERREFVKALALLSDAFDTCRRTGWRVSYPEFRGAFAQALAGVGRPDEALVAVDEALLSAAESDDGQQWYVPELLRIKGDVLLDQGAGHSAPTAEECFQRGAEMARQQGALFWELRVALSGTELRVRQGRQDEARQILIDVYDRFTEGFNTADMLSAKALLETLPASR